LINRTKQEINSQLQQQQLLQLLQLLQLIETILVYKLPKMSRTEIEAIFGLSELKQTRVYQEALEEGELLGKLKAVKPMLSAGLSVEQIAEALDLSVE
jgi:predicted transposase/invertase (TIGR01784 family)